MSVILSSFAGAGAQFFSNNGVVLNGGKIYSYAAGTTTPLQTYTSANGVTAHTNPIVLNSAGRVPGGEIWLLESASYKFVLTDSNDVLISTYDNINSLYVGSDLSNTSDPTKGDALVGFRQSNASGNLTNAVGRTVHQKFQEYVSVKDFGAVGDGTTDDTAAFQSAFNSCASTGSALRIPAGSYILSNLISASAATNVFSIFGDGDGSTKLIWTSAGGIRLDYSSATNYRRAHGGVYRDLCLFSRVLTGAGTAFTYIGSASGSGSTNSVSFENIYIDNDVLTNNTNYYWNNGINITDGHSASVLFCYIYGNRNLSATDYSGSGIIINEDCTEGAEIIGCAVGSWNKAVELKATAATSGTEGARVIACTLVTNGYGVYADNSLLISAGNPGLNVTNNHISSTLADVYLIGANQIHISENLIYVRPDSTSATFYGIYVNDCTSGIISNNIFSYSISIATAYGIYVEGGVGLVIDGNLVQSSNVTVGAYLSATTARVILGAGNYFNQAVTGVVNNIPLLSNYKTIQTNAPGYGRINYLTQSVPNNTATKLNLNGNIFASVVTSQVYNAANPTRLVIPKSVSRVTLNASVTFVNNGTGYRRIDILDNTGAIVATTTVVTVSGISIVFAIVSKVLDVVTGDYFELSVTQTSGGALDAEGGARSFLEATYIS